MPGGMFVNWVQWGFSTIKYLIAKITSEYGTGTPLVMSKTP